MFNQSATTNELLESNFQSASAEENQLFDKAFDIELLLKVLDHTSYKGNGRWIGTCPSCKSTNQTLILQQKPLEADGFKQGFSRSGALRCTEKCSTGSVISALKLSSSTLFFDADLFEYSPYEYEYLISCESAIILIRDELETLAKKINSNEIDWNDERLLNRIYFVAAGLHWMRKEGRYVAMSDKSSIDSSSSDSH